jgi:hypothetical protein
MRTTPVAPITRKKTIKHVVNQYGLRCGRGLYAEFERKAEELLYAICSSYLESRVAGGHSSVSQCTHQPALDLSPAEGSHAVSSTPDIPKHTASAGDSNLHPERTEDEHITP